MLRPRDDVVSFRRPDDDVEQFAGVVNQRLVRLTAGVENERPDCVVSAHRMPSVGIPSSRHAARSLAMVSRVVPVAMKIKHIPVSRVIAVESDDDVEQIEVHTTTAKPTDTEAK